MTRVMVIGVCLTIAALLSSCGQDKDGEGGEDLAPLSTEQKVDALSVFLEWDNLRSALEHVASNREEPATDKAIQSLVSEIRRLCAVRGLPEGGHAFATAAEKGKEKTARLDLTVIGPSSQFPSCPIQFRHKIRVEGRLSGDQQQLSRGFEASYAVRSTDAPVFSPIRRMKYKGSLDTTSGATQGDLRHWAREVFSGQIEIGESGPPIPIRFKRETLTQFSGAESMTKETLERSAFVARRTVEWRQEREMRDLKLTKERHFLNKEEVSSTDFEKLRVAASGADESNASGAE